MKALRIIAMLFLSFLLVSSVSAELVVNKHVSDFTLSSPYNEQLKLCACETKVDTLIVENVGNFQSQYTADIVSNYPGRIRIEERQFGLAPKHHRELVVYIEDSCGLVGTWDYTVEVNSNYGRVERLSRTINSQICQTSIMTVEPDHVETGLCEPANFEVTLKNVGTYADTFRLDFGQYNDIAEYTHTELYLVPDQEFSQEVSFTQACEFHGDYDVPFILTTDSGTPGAYDEGSVTVRNEYAFGLDLETSLEACALSETHFPLIVENDAPVEDEFTLVLQGPGFLSIDGEQVKELTISAENAREVSLIVTPGTQDIGEHELTIHASDRFGGISKSRTTDITVSNCFDPEVQLMITEVEPAIEPVATCCGPKTYFVNVQNNGDREQVFRLEIDGPSFFILEETTVRVQPSQNINVPIRANLPCSDETYEFSVSVSPVQNPEIVESSSMTIESQTQRTCHMVQIDDDELAVRETDGVLPVIVKHTGIEGGDYFVEMNSTMFSIQEDILQLSPGEQTVIHLEPTVNLTEQEKGRYILQPQFTLSGLNIDYNEHVGVQLKGKTFWQAFTDWLSGVPWCTPGVCGWFAVGLFVLLVALVILLLVIWLGGFTLFKGGLPTSILTALKTFLVILVGLTLLAILLVPGPSASSEYERLASDQNATVLEWYQNQDLTIDLDQYFEDPDMDTLSYSASQPRDISVEIEGNSMTLKPDTNWAGENTMVITAEDGKGGQTDSPLFLLRVIAKAPVTFWEWVNLWCTQIILVEFLLVLLVLLLMLVTVKEERPEEDPNGNVIVVVPGKARKKPARRKTSRKVAPKRVSRKRPAKTTKKTKAVRKKATKKTRRRAATKGRSRKTTRKTASKKVSRRKPAKKTAKKRSAKKGKVVRVPAKRNANSVKRAEVMPSPPSKDDKSQTVNIQLNIKQ